MKPIKLLIVLGFFMLSSCTTTKTLTSSVKPFEVTDLQQIEPYSYISKIGSGNKRKLNDTASIESRQLLIKIVNELKGQIPLTGEITVSDTTIKRKLEKEIEFLCISADRLKSITDLKITPIIDSLLDKKGKRFGLITVSVGFTREKGNYGKQVAKGAAMGILTLGMYYQTPIKANSTIYVMIVDAQENNISFFRKSSLQDKEPLDEKILTKQFKDIFDGYFWTTK
jgi:hypothetical protein